MGIPGLWDLIRKSAKPASLSALAHDAFLANKNGRRAFTVGIDAAIWVFHAQIPVHGENPFLRTIFYKIVALLQQPVLPVFVFDGPKKPSQKRNNKVAGHFGTADHRSKQFKALLDLCGLEWWNAPGEAEAELAVMNRQGKIDAVLSDDGDALLFGATCLLRNNSPTLSGAQASSTQQNSSKSDARHYEVYRSSAIRELWAEKTGSKLESEEDDRMAMALIALLGGGDYAPEGLSTFGHTIAFGLANAGFASYLRLYKTDKATFRSTLPQIHSEMIQELRSNASSQMRNKNPARAGMLSSHSPEAIFSEYALDAYLHPATSPPDDPSKGWQGFRSGSISGRGSLEGMARACETYFEWGTRELVVKKFMGEGVGLFGIQILNEARDRILRKDDQNGPIDPVAGRRSSETQPHPVRITSFFGQTQSTASTSAKQKFPVSTTSAASSTPPHLLKIHSTRRDPTNPDIVEYRISFNPELYISRCREAMEGSRIDPKDLPLAERQSLGLVERASPEDEDEAVQATQSTSSKGVRVWMAEYLVREAYPSLLDQYEASINVRLNRSPKKKQAVGKGVKAVKSKGKGRGKDQGQVETISGENRTGFRAFFASQPRALMDEPDSEVEEVLENVSSSSPSSSMLRSPTLLAVPIGSRSSRTWTGTGSSSPPIFKPKPKPTSLSHDIAQLPSSDRDRTSPRSKKNARSHPASSSLSSTPCGSCSDGPAGEVLTGKTPDRASLPSSSPPPVVQPDGRTGRRRKNVYLTKSTPVTSQRNLPSTSSTSTAKGGKDDPIVLSDGDESPHKPARRSPRASSRTDVVVSPARTILAESDETNHPPSPTTGQRRRSTRGRADPSANACIPQPDSAVKSSATRRGKTANLIQNDKEVQKLLGFPIVRSSPLERSNLDDGNKVAPNKGHSKVVRKERETWKLVRSTEEVDYIDCTGLGWIGGFDDK